MQYQPETVHTVTDFYDGPRDGIADYHGNPHVYRSLFDAAKDDWDDSFLLKPIDDETFQMAMEDWGIWTRWERALFNGQTTQATHPALPDERERHDELAAILKVRLRIDPERAIRVRGKFTVQKPGVIGASATVQYVVHWF